MVTLSNMMFSLRAILGKRVRVRHGTGPVMIFFQLCSLGAAMQAALLISRAGFVHAAAPHTMLRAAAAAVGAQPLALLVCGVSFFSQLQLSFVCLSRMSAVTHSLANSMRRQPPSRRRSPLRRQRSRRSTGSGLPSRS